MTIKTTEQEIKSLYPEQYKEIAAGIKKKKRDIKEATWGYGYGIMIGGNQPEATTEDEALEFATETMTGISIEAKIGRSRTSSMIGKDDILAGLKMRKRQLKVDDVLDKKSTNVTISFPPAIEKNIIDNFKSKQEKNNVELNFQDNMDSVLKAVGKTGSSKVKVPQFGFGNGMQLMQHMQSMANATQPEFPTIKDIKQVRPDIYDKYSKLADGSKLVFFNPGAQDADEWGFNLEDIKLATYRLKEGKNARVVVSTGMAYQIDGTVANWIGFLQGTDKAEKSAEGTEFTGWKRTKQYRLTKQEISDVVKNNIYSFGMSLGF